MAERETRYIPPSPAQRLEMTALIVEQPEQGGGDSKGYYTVVFDVGQFQLGWEGEKADIPVVRVEHVPSSSGAQFEAVIKVENGHESHTIVLPGLDEQRLFDLAGTCNTFVQSKRAEEVRGHLPELARALATQVGQEFRVEATVTSAEIRPYLPYNPENPPKEDNLKDLAWLIEHCEKERDRDVDQSGERLLKVEIGDKEFEFLQSGDMYFVLNNVPTIAVMDAAIREGIISEQEKKDFISMEEEMCRKQATLAQYQAAGEQTGEGKDLRPIWRDSEAHYEYDAVRRLYYLEIAGEPVMDEFEREYIELLGANAAQYDHAVLEVGFGMGISANAIQKELVKHQEHGKQPVHVIIEFNRDVAQRARQWAKRQKAPVVVLEGDWKEKIKELPEGILTGALADPYPLNAGEKHKDAVLAAKEVHDRLRPGGVLTYYADSQYALSPDHAAIAQEAGFKYIGVITSRFARPGTNFGEYYRSPRMAIPRLYKEGGTGSAEREAVVLDQQRKQDLLRKILVEDPKRFRETYFGSEVDRFAA